NEPIADRRAALRAREDRWLKFSPSARHSVKLPVKWAETSIYDVAADAFAFAHGVKIEFIRTLRDGPSVWKTIDGAGPILNFCIAAGWDLVVLITVTMSAVDPSVQVIEAQLMQLSTNIPHPSAPGAQAFVVANVPLTYGLPRVQVDVVDIALGISLYFPDGEDVNLNCFYLVDWPSGDHLLKVPFEINTPIFTFLHTPVLVVIADAATHSLDAYVVEDDFPLLVSLKLPALKSSYTLIWEDVECRGQPNPDPDGHLRGSSRRTNFIPDPEKSMFVVALQILDEAAAEDNDDVDSLPVLVFISRPQLLRIVTSAHRNYSAQPQSDDSRTVDVPFATWGPKCSLWFDATGLRGNPVTGQIGQRFVSFKTAVRETGNPGPIQIMDFNPRTVQSVRRLFQSSSGLDMESASLEPDVDAPPGSENFQFPAFEERIVSELAYVETTSKAKSSTSSHHQSPIPHFYRHLGITTWSDLFPLASFTTLVVLCLRAMSRANTRKCPYTNCGRIMSLKQAAGGALPGSTYYQCRNDDVHHIYMYYASPGRSVFPAAAHRCPQCHGYLPWKNNNGVFEATCRNPQHEQVFCTTLPPLAATQTFPASQATPHAPSNAISAASRSANGCLVTNCRAGPTKLHTSCKKQMCRKHCNEDGYCVYAGHELHRQKKLGTHLPPPLPPPSTQPPVQVQRPRPTLDIVQDTREQNQRAFDALEVYRRSKEAEMYAFDQSLPYDLDAPSPPMSLEADYRLAMQVQKLLDEENEVRDEMWDVPMAGSSRLTTPPLSQRPLPTTLVDSPELSPVPLLSSLVSKPRATGARARMTQQLDANWRAPPANPSTTAFANVPPTSFLNVRPRKQRRQQDLSLTQRFKLLFLNGKEPQLVAIDVASNPALVWPTYRLSDDPDTMTKIRINSATELQLHSAPFWMEIPTNYAHTVKTDTILILRERGTFGEKDDVALDAVLHPKQEPHIRNNLPDERKVVRLKLKSLGVIDVDSDIEVVSHKPRPSKRKRMPSVETVGITTPKMVRPRLHINTSLASSFSSSSSDEDNSPPPSALSLQSTGHSSATSSSAATPIDGSSDDESVLDEDIRWPKGITVKEMEEGFKVMKKMKDTDSTLDRSARFTAAFKRPYRSSTYDRQIKIWRRASSALLHEGRENDELWTTFRKRVPSDKAAGKRVLSKKAAGKQKAV
ncbi:hypothetical protein C8F01DRAFT_1274775, partial [Mycena amicta]